MTIEYATRISVREKSLVMLPDQIFAAVSRNVSIGDGNRSLLTQPALAAIHQIPTSRMGPTASSRARRNPLLFSLESALRIAAPAFPEGRTSLAHLIAHAVRPRASLPNRVERKWRVVQRTVHFCILKREYALINLHSCMHIL